jgi:hypothetical protein
MKGVGLAIAFVGAVAGVVALLPLLQQKDLSYRVLYVTPFSNFDQVDGGVRVFVDSVEVQGLSFLAIEVVNSGDEPIRSADFEGPLVVNLGDDARIYRAVVRSDQPLPLRFGERPASNQLTIRPVLLNPGDAFVVRVTGTGLEGAEIDVHARIAGVKALVDRTEPKEEGDAKLREIYALSIAFFFISFAAMTGFFYDGIGRDIEMGNGLILVFMVLWITTGFFLYLPIVEFVPPTLEELKGVVFMGSFGIAILGSSGLASGLLAINRGLRMRRGSAQTTVPPEGEGGPTAAGDGAGHGVDHPEQESHASQNRP